MTHGFLGRTAAAAAMAGALLAGCSGGVAEAPPGSGDPPPQPPAPPPEPVPVALKLFSVSGNGPGDALVLGAYVISAQSGQPLPETDYNASGMYLYADKVLMIDARDFDGARIVRSGSTSYEYAEEGGYQVFAGWTNSTSTSWPYLVSGGGWKAAVLPSGEGDTIFDHVSLIETASTSFDGTSGGIGSSNFYVFGFETGTSAASGNPSYLGTWRGQIVTGGPDGVNLNSGYDVSGQSWIIADFSKGEISGIMAADTITRTGYSYGYNPPPEIGLSSITFLGTTDGTTFNGTAKATASILDPVDSMSGVISGAFYGPGAEEIGGVFEMTEPGVRGFTYPEPYVALIGAFAGR